MKVAFLLNAFDHSSAIFNLVDHVCRNMRVAEGTLVERRALSQYSTGYDVLVTDSPWTAAQVRPHLPKQCIVTLCHGFEPGPVGMKQLRFLNMAQPDYVIVTSDEEILSLVHREGFKGEHVPISFNTDRFSHTPYPDEFTIGYLGSDLVHKRFDYIEDVARSLGVKVVGSRRDGHVAGEYANREMDFYSAISCYVCATTCEKAPFPTAEALVCGRPLAITPQVTSPPELIAAVEGGAGERMDDLHEAIARIRDDFDTYMIEACKFKLRDTTADYEAAILRVLEVQ